jgi:hypothetical protein
VGLFWLYDPYHLAVHVYREGAAALGAVDAEADVVPALAYLHLEPVFAVGTSRPHLQRLFKLAAGVFPIFGKFLSDLVKIV